MPGIVAVYAYLVYANILPSVLCSLASAELGGDQSQQRYLMRRAVGGGDTRGGNLHDLWVDVAGRNFQSRAEHKRCGRIREIGRAHV